MGDWIKTNIVNAFPEADVVLEGEACHLKVIIRSDILASMPKIKQHREVYKAIGKEVGQSIHALSIEVQPSQPK